MRRFDWRQFEPSDAREYGWPDQISTDPSARYRDRLYDSSVWLRLVGRLRELPPELPELNGLCLSALDWFLANIPATVVRPSIPCVFISHQRADTARGIRVACLVDQHGLDSWLDVYDPTLTLVNQLPATDPRKSVLIAATIEIALLSCTHVIALHTSNSIKSRWLPYELGRAKARSILSTQAAGWFERGQDETTCGDYVQLAVMARNEIEIDHWLQQAAIGQPNRGSVPATPECIMTVPLK